ncbi:MAG: T9SS type A sorting domain-containing protein [Bacteroidales bacterium]|nr:T9SS type A sorting domain-containing protein [Bacteroidales bacterium]
MKRKLYTFALALLCAGAFSQSSEIHKEFGQAWGGGTSVDINSDGHLDFIIAGQKNNPIEPVLDEEGNPVDADNDSKPDSSERWIRICLYNPATSEYDIVPTNLRIADRPNLDWYDIDDDGLLDVLVGEHSFANYHGGIYRNLGDGYFEKQDLPFDTAAMSGAFGDFNRDGLFDYFLLSHDSLGSAVYINQGNNEFEAINQPFGEFSFGLGHARVVDINNDGLQDIFVSANWDNSAFFEHSARVFTDFFLNNDEEPGTFYRANIGDNGVKMKGNGGVDFADFNEDGLLDFALHGEGGEGTGEPGSGEDVWKCISHVYLNQGNNLFADQPQTAFQPDLRPLNSTGKATATIDWNIDGHYDLILSGWNPIVGGVGANTQAGYLYSGTGTGTFAEVGRVPGGSETVILFNDWNDDGVLDYLASGHTWDEMWVTGDDQGRSAVVYFNTNTVVSNEAPDAPEGLSATKSGSNVTLSWDAATDDLTASDALTYEVYIMDENDRYLIAPASFVGGNNDGLRKIIQMGNANLNLSLKLFGLADGVYTWGVQAIDASYVGSPFATGEFSIGAPSALVDNEAISLAKIYTRNRNLYVNLITSPDAKISVLNMVGQTIDSKTVWNSYSIALGSGIYIVKVTVGNQTEIRKIVVD